MEVPSNPRLIDEGVSFALERFAVIITEPPFSEIDSSEAVKVTTGSSSSLILISREVSSPRSTFPGLAIDNKIFSIGSSISSCNQLK